MKISAVILAKNEQDNIKGCIEALRFCEEILVIDDDSSDKTHDIARKLGAHVYKRSLNKNYARQKNFALEKTKGEWTIFVDADERISKRLSEEIGEKVKEDKYNVVSFSRVDHFLGKQLKYGETGKFRDIRMMKKNTGKWRRRVHEYFDSTEVIGEAKNPILHYSHPTVRSLIKSINKWSSWHALANSEEGKTPSIIKILFWPKLKFIGSFILKRGFLDGLHGFVFAIFISFHSFLSWSTLWLEKRK